MSVIIGMKWSVVAFAAALVLGFLGMGALGAALYYACYPLLGSFYGNLNDWHGDWVWSATIWAGVLWSLTFLVAGGLNLYLAPHASVLMRSLGYVLVLWLGAALIWALILGTSYKTQGAAYASPCHDKTYIEMAVRGAPLQLTPADLIRTSCTVALCKFMVVAHAFARYGTHALRTSRRIFNWGLAFAVLPLCAIVPFALTLGQAGYPENAIPAIYLSGLPMLIPVIHLWLEMRYRPERT